MSLSLYNLFINRRFQTPRHLCTSAKFIPKTNANKTSHVFIICVASEKKDLEASGENLLKHLGMDSMCGQVSATQKQI